MIVIVCVYSRTIQRQSELRTSVRKRGRLRIRCVIEKLRDPGTWACVPVPLWSWHMLWKISGVVAIARTVMSISAFADCPIICSTSIAELMLTAGT